MKYLLDTNIVSETMRAAPSAVLVANLSAHDGQFGIAAITWLELAFGVRRLPQGARRTALEARLRDLQTDLPPPLPFTTEAADWLASERARLEKRGRTITLEDGQIAATAHVAHLVLVTANTKDFAHYLGLRVRDWTQKP